MLIEAVVPMSSARFWIENADLGGRPPTPRRGQGQRSSEESTRALHGPSAASRLRPEAVSPLSKSAKSVLTADSSRASPD
jgi:hypothetical protein